MKRIKPITGLILSATMLAVVLLTIRPTGTLAQEPTPAATPRPASAWGRLPPARVIHLMLQICGSLSEAHQLGMIHRDIKPSNVILTAGIGIYDMVKVLDFGLVKQIDGDLLESVSLDLTLTQSEGIIGTPMYMSPETVRVTVEASS